MSLALTLNVLREKSKNRALRPRHRRLAGSAFCLIALLAASILLAIPRPSPAEWSAGVALAADNKTTTVLTCEPLLIGLGAVATATMNTTLSGFAPAHGTPVSVPPSNDLTYAGLLKGRDNLNDSIRNTPGKKIVFGYSRGAQIASEWLRTYAGKAGAPSASDLSFVLIGNPQRRLGGDLGKTLDGVALQPTPDNTRYTVTDISRRWDGWANADNWPDGPNSGAQAKLANNKFSGAHTSYWSTSIDSPQNQTRAVVGNTTYVVAP